MTGEAYIQWKGTNACLDFHCPNCQYHSHWDDEFLYNIRCPKCLLVWKLGDTVTATWVEDANKCGVIRELHHEQELLRLPENADAMHEGDL